MEIIPTSTRVSAEMPEPLDYRCVRSRSQMQISEPLVGAETFDIGDIYVHQVTRYEGAAAFSYWVCQSHDGGRSGRNRYFWRKVEHPSPQSTISHPHKDIPLFLQVKTGDKPTWVLKKSLQRQQQLENAARRRNRLESRGVENSEYARE